MTIIVQSNGCYHGQFSPFVTASAYYFVQNPLRIRYEKVAETPCRNVDQPTSGDNSVRAPST
jgi:hypothetical protein